MAFRNAVRVWRQQHVRNGNICMRVYGGTIAVYCEREKKLNLISVGMAPKLYRTDDNNCHWKAGAFGFVLSDSSHKTLGSIVAINRSCYE